MRILLTIFILISISGFGQRSYTIPKDDFIKQFSDTVKFSRIYCINKDGQKVWLNNARGFLTTLTLKDTRKKVKFDGGRYEAGQIIGKKLTAKLVFETISVDFDRVSLISIRSPYAIESPYFNIDSVKNLQILKNDSLMRRYSSGNQVVIRFEPIDETKNSFLIFESACYHIGFKDDRQVKYGVIHKITPDSIFVFSSFNPNTANRDHVEYKLLKYPINDVIGLQFPRNGGYSFKDVSVKDYNLTTTVMENKDLMPVQFVLNPITGKIRLYRQWLAEQGYYFLTEENGKLYWLEK